MRPIINCLGAGIFIEENTLREIGGFAEPVEDLVLGYKLNIKNKRVEPLPYINIMQPYLYMKEMINSHSRIFMIGLRLYREGTYIECLDCVYLLFCEWIHYRRNSVVDLYHSITFLGGLYYIGTRD